MVQGGKSILHLVQAFNDRTEIKVPWTTLGHLCPCDIHVSSSHLPLPLQISHLSFPCMENLCLLFEPQLKMSFPVGPGLLIPAPGALGSLRCKDLFPWLPPFVHTNQTCPLVPVSSHPAQGLQHSRQMTSGRMSVSLPSC